MGSCTSRQTKKTIKSIAESEELHNLIRKLYYDTLYNEPAVPDKDQRLKKIEKHFKTSKYIDSIIYP
jgi:hypothetical protein